jgi:hypothetical protein
VIIQPYYEFPMPMSVEELFSKQQQVSSRDLQDCGWLQTQFPESFGSGGLLGPEIGMDGHIWVIIPITESGAATAAKRAGLQRSIHEIIPDSDTGGWKLHANFYKFARGFFKAPAWVCSTSLTNSRRQILLGFIAATNLRQFAPDIRLMIELGIPTFPSAPEAFEAVP